MTNIYVFEKEFSAVSSSHWCFFFINYKSENAYIFIVCERMQIVIVLYQFIFC